MIGGERTAGRPAPAVLAITAAAAALIWLLGGGQADWLALPAVLLAIGRCPSRRGAGIAGALLLPAAGLAGAAAGGRGAPSALVLVAVTAACAGILISVRESLERERDAMRDSALTDALTGVANRRSLRVRTDYEISRHTRSGLSFAVAMIDLDGFKPVNDRLGHAAGDDLLRRVAAGLRRAMRGQDTVARFGGDEFCVLAPETDETGVLALGLRIREAVDGLSTGPAAVTASVGIAVFPRDGTSVAELVGAADDRLLAAKRERYDGRARRRAA
jgi:diguanylate cyclase (GGDEF)-like protein